MSANINFKDIGQLLQKATIAGTEKIPVSDTEYVTTTQIASLGGGGGGGGVSDVTLDGTSVVSGGVAVLPAYPTTVASMTDASNYPKYVLLADEAAYAALATKDSGTLYLIPKTS